MADVLIAAADDANAGARGLAEALAALGFSTDAEPPEEAELTKAVDAVKCVVTWWPAPDAPTPPWVAAFAALALERNKLVSLEFVKDATPALFRGAARIDLSECDQASFKARFDALIGEIEKRAPLEAGTAEDRRTEALGKAYLALAPVPKPPEIVEPVPAAAPGPVPLPAHATAPPVAKPDIPPGAATPTIKPQAPKRRSARWTIGMIAAAVAVVFVVGFGAGRLINAARSGELFAWFSGATTTAVVTPPASQPAPLGVTLAELEALPWRDAAAKIDEPIAERIKAQAQRGNAYAQTLACLGHLAGSPGFLPSPAAARRLCDAASAQDYPAALYLSYVVRRTAPHVAISETDARARLRAASEQGWLPAQLDYAQLLAGDFRTSLADQTAAGRLWLTVADRGDARGQYNYARWLRDSPAGPRDPSSAVPYLERAATSGLAEAQHMLGTLYRDGIGVTRDPARARTLYEQAAEQSYPASMFNLAAMIDTGPVRDQARAAELYRALSCMRDERQIQPMAAARLQAMRQLPATCS
jgi:TPR repeat protein